MDKRIKKFILTAIFGSMSIILYMFPKFPLPIFPSFLEVNFSMLPIAICGFALGPIYGLICVGLRFLGKLLFLGTNSVLIGEIMDLILGVVVVLVISIFYKILKFKDSVKAIVSLSIGLVFWIITSIILNAFYALPQYLKLFFDGNVDVLVGALKVIPGVDNDNYISKYILFAVIPFNSMLAIAELLVTFLVHKKIRLIYDDRDEKKESVETNDELE